MKPAEKLKIILVDMPGSGLGPAFADRLRSAGHTVVGRFTTDDSLPARVEQAGADLLVIGAPAPSETLLLAMQSVSDRAVCPIVFYCAGSAAADVRSIVSAGANAVAAGTGQHTDFPTLVNIAFAEFRKISALRRERDAALTRLAERKLVERAKGIIMKERNLGEDEAYRLLRKLAMDRSEPLIRLANRVIEASRLLK